MKAFEVWTFSNNKIWSKISEHETREKAKEAILGLSFIAGRGYVIVEHLKLFKRADLNTKG